MTKKAKLKRGSSAIKVYKKGSQSAVTAKAKENYNKINFKNKAVDAFNDITSRVGNRKKRRAGSPFSRVGGWYGSFGNAPKLPGVSSHKPYSTQKPK